MGLSVPGTESEFHGDFGVWLSRLLITVIFGYQFRTPLSLVTKLLLVNFAILFTLGQISNSSQEAKLWNRHLSIAAIGQSLDYQMWLQCIIPSAFIVKWLHRQGPSVRVASLALCWTHSITMLRDWTILDAVLPFHTLNTPAALFYLLLVFSTAYHSRQHLAEFYRLLREFLAFIEAKREAAQNADLPSQEEVKLEAANAQDSRVAAEATQEAAERCEEHTKWANSYKYEPLLGDEIRLLELLPTTDSDAAELRCRLKCVSLASAENDYTALSYTWGSDMQERHITIEGAKVRVTVNLYDALSELRDHGIKYLWADALCINQEDWLERSAQVLRISTIYRKANEVVVWLGTNRESKKVMGLLKSISPDQNVACPNIEVMLGTRDGRDEPSLDDFKTFLSRPYWRRVWIIQEVAAASKVTIVDCGERVAWENLRRLVNDIVDSQQISPSRNPVFFEQLRLVKSISDIREGRISNIPLGLLEALAQTKASISTVLQDKVFGLLGLAIDRHDFADPPNYTLEDKEMCMKMTQYFILSKQNLDIILAGPPGQRVSSLPSWCPDYLHVAEQPLGDHFVKYLSGKDKHHRLGKEGCYWRTTEHSRAVESVSFWLKDDLLRVMGLPIGTIDGLGPTTAGGSERRYSLNRSDTNSSGRRSSEAPDRNYSTYNGLCRMILVYDKKYSKFTNAPILLGMLYNVAYQAFAACSTGDANTVRQWLIANRNFSIHSKKLGDRAWFSFRPVTNYLKGFIKPKTTTMTVLDYPHITKSITEIVKEGLHLMTTREGAVGWAHQEANLDDEIFLFAGCSVPVILRQRPGSEGYNVVGHAYVDGCMDGEKWREHIRNQTTLVEVKIWLHPERHHPTTNGARHPTAPHPPPTLRHLASKTPTLTLLHVGAGSGTITASFAAYMLSQGRIITIDISDEILQKAAKYAEDMGVRQIVQTQKASIYELPHEDGSFDIVHTSQMLAHLDERGRAVKEMVRVATKPGGVVALRKSDIRARSVYAEYPGPVATNKMFCAMHEANGANVNAGAQLVTWGLKDGVEREKIHAGTGKWFYFKREERGLLGTTMADRCVNGMACKKALELGIATEEGLKEMEGALKKCVEAEDGRCRCLHGEVLIKF